MLPVSRANLLGEQQARLTGSIINLVHQSIGDLGKGMTELRNDTDLSKGCRQKIGISPPGPGAHLSLEGGIVHN